MPTNFRLVSNSVYFLAALKNCAIKKATIIHLQVRMLLFWNRLCLLVYLFLSRGYVPLVLGTDLWFFIRVKADSGVERLGPHISSWRTMRFCTNYSENVHWRSVAWIPCFRRMPLPDVVFSELVLFIWSVESVWNRKYILWTFGVFLLYTGYKKYLFCIFQTKKGSSESLRCLKIFLNKEYKF